MGELRQVRWQREQLHQCDHEPVGQPELLQVLLVQRDQGEVQVRGRGARALLASVRGQERKLQVQALQQRQEGQKVSADVLALRARVAAAAAARVRGQEGHQVVCQEDEGRQKVEEVLQEDGQQVRVDVRGVLS